MKKDFKFYCFSNWKHLKGPFDSFLFNDIVIESSRSFDELNDLFPFTHEEVKCVENTLISEIPLNVPIQLKFGDPRLTPNDVIVTKVVHKNGNGIISPYLRVVVDNSTIIYFRIWGYNSKTRFGYIDGRLTIPADLVK